jgi:hypothetical protein
MRFLKTTFWSLLATGFVALAPAPAARADVWLFDVLTLRSQAPTYQADAYVGALEIVARRHGGIRVASAREIPDLDRQSAGHIVGLWRFRDEAALDALLADPTFQSLASLQERTFDPTSTRSIERVRAASSNGE